MARPRIPLRQRLSNFLGAPIDQLDPNACWAWGGTVYDWKPIVRLNGKRVPARRAVYQELVRELEAWERVKAVCGHPTCVNPYHAMVIGLGEPAYEPELCPDVLEPPPDEDLDAEFVADLILQMKTSDPDEMARLIGAPIELVHQALALGGMASIRARVEAHAQRCGRS